MLEGDIVTTKTQRSYVLEASFSYTFSDDETPDISSFLDQVVDHLQDDLGVGDVTVVLDKGVSEFSMSLLIPSYDQESIETVVGKGMGLLRTAFHKCEAHTPGWPTVHEALLGVKVTPAVIAGQLAWKDEALKLVDA